MAFVNIGVILDKAAEFEKKLESYYIQIRDNTVNEGVKLLTYYLSRHRLHQKEAFSTINKEGLQRIKNIKLKYDIEFDLGNELIRISRSLMDVTGRELLEAAVEYNQKLIVLYEKIQKQALQEEANNLIECLISIEKKDIVMLKKTMATDYY